MRDRSLQSGATHLIIIVIIIIAVVLGALGFVFWQNFINKPISNTTSNSSSSDRLVYDLNSKYEPSQCIDFVTDERIEGSNTLYQADTCVSKDGRLFTRIEGDEADYAITTQEVASSDSTSISIDEWGVKLAVSSGTPTIKYYKDSTSTYTRDGIKVGEDEVDYGFTTKRVDELGSDCSGALSVTGIGYHLVRLYRQKTIDDNLASPPTLVGHVGDYYYYSGAAQSSCSNDPIISTDRQSLINVVDSLQEAF